MSQRGFRLPLVKWPQIRRTVLNFIYLFIYLFTLIFLFPGNRDAKLQTIS